MNKNNMNSYTSPSLLSWSPKKMSATPVASPPCSRIGKYVNMPIMSGAKHLPEDVAQEDALLAAKAKPRSPLLPPVPIKHSFPPLLIRPATCSTSLALRGPCCGNIVETDVIVRLNHKQHLWKNKATGKNEENTIDEAVWVTYPLSVSSPRRTSSMGLSTMASYARYSTALTKELELLEDHVAFGDDSGLAPPSLFCHGARHLDGLEVGREVGEVIVEGWRREVRVGDVVRHLIKL
jgi:hypothetical protein